MTSVSEFAASVFDANPNDGPWEKYKLSPRDRNMYPSKIHSTAGLISGAEHLVGNDSTTTTYLESDDASITLEFDINTCGIYSIEFGDDSTPGQTLHITFAESAMFIDKDCSDRSMDFFIEDMTLEVPVDKGIYTCSWDKQRGGFKYMTLSTRKSTGQIAIKSVKTVMNCMPSLGDNLANYSGYFYSSDDFANTIWYAGAYTVQMATIPTSSGRTHDYLMPPTGWSNSLTCGCGDEVLTDGARRDRSVWSGDRFITQTSESIAFNSKASINGTDWMLKFQTDEGEFPYACYPIDSYGSDTYSLWTIMSIYDCYLRLGLKNTKWILDAWPKWLACIEYAYRKIDHTGCMKVSHPLDWGRPNLEGHPLSLNCILYKMLTLTEKMAVEEFKDEKVAKLSKERAVKLRKAIYDLLWDSEAGMFKDTDVTKVHCQDGNSLSLLFGVAPKEHYDSISHGLSTHWNEFGAVAVETQGMISPFQSSIELYAHAAAGHPERSLELFKTMWGYIWNSPYGVKSTLIEGYFKDGSCKYPFTFYDPAYISHAHPWSSGPTTLFTYNIVGLQIVNLDHSKWVFKPEGVFVENSYAFAQTGFTSNILGFISAGWKKQSDSILQLSIKAPESLLGEIWVPAKPGTEALKLELDGKDVLSIVESVDGYYKISDVAQGEHTILAYYK